MDEHENRQRKKRWRLALGGEAEEESDEPVGLTKAEKQIDQVLERLYRSDRTGGQSPSIPVSAKWFSNIRELFPQKIIRLLQKDAIDRFGIKKLLSQASILEEVEPDIDLVANILTVKDVLPPASLNEARNLISRLARAVEAQLRFRLISRLSGRKEPGKRISNPRLSDIDWHLTIRQNLKNYQPSLGTIIPDKMFGRPRYNKALKKLILLVDQSASMTDSMIYASILAGIMASIRSIQTHFVVFDTSVVDLTESLSDSVELLFKIQLGGGTDIQRALGYADTLIDPNIDTHIVLISDLYEGVPEELLYQRCQRLLNKSVHIIVLLALDDGGKPAYDSQVAAKLASLGIPSFASTPEQFPEVMAAALNKEDLSRFQ